MKDDVILVCKIIYEPAKDSWNRFKALFPICFLMGILINLSFNMMSNIFSQAILLSSILSTFVFFYLQELFRYENFKKWKNKIALFTLEYIAITLFSFIMFVIFYILKSLLFKQTVPMSEIKLSIGISILLTGFFGIYYILIYWANKGCFQEFIEYLQTFVIKKTKNAKIVAISVAHISTITIIISAAYYLLQQVEKDSQAQIILKIFNIN
jgi:membrane protein